MHEPIDPAVSAKVAGSASLIRRERRIIVAFLVAAFAAFGVALLGSEINEDGPFGFDKALLLLLRDPVDPSQPVGPLWLRSGLLDLTALGGGTVLTLFTLVVIGYLIAARKIRTALFVAAATGAGAILSGLLKLLFERARPDVVTHLVEVSSASFPSGHAMNSAIIYLTLGALLARAEPDRRRTIFILGAATMLTLLVGFSRVYLGVHWPTDVLAGWAVGGSWALLCWEAELKLQQRRQIEPASQPA